MDERRVSWWMDAGSDWHRGFPPSGWWQAEDGRWHPPGDDEPTVEMREGPSAVAAHLAGGPRSPTVVGGWGWPRWARIAVLASVALIAVGVVGTAAITDGGGDDDQATVTASTTTTDTPDTSAGSPTPTNTPPGSASVASPPTSDDTAPPAPPTTAQATTTTTAVSQAPPTPAPTNPLPSDPGVRQGESCSPEGATAVSPEGVPMTCTTQKCHGAPFDSARWRRSAC